MRKKEVDLSREVWEGWTVGDFVEEMLPQADMIMHNESCMHKPFKSKKDLKDWCISNQPYHKKYVPDVVEYFAARYGLR